MGLLAWERSYPWHRYCDDVHVCARRVVGRVAIYYVYFLGHPSTTSLAREACSQIYEPLFSLLFGGHANERNTLLRTSVVSAI